MNYYTQIPIWENLRRGSYLQEFRKLVTSYFENTSYDYLGGEEVDDKALKTRAEINKMSSLAGKFIQAAGISTKITHYPAPAVGGYVTNIDVIFNIFNLHNYDILPIHVIDDIDKAIGVYEADKSSAMVRTFNPFFWLGKLLSKISSIPFTLLKIAGFESEKIRKSLIGKLLSLLFQVVALIASIMTILQVLGYNETIKTLRGVLDSYIK